MILINFFFIYVLQILLTFPNFELTCEKKTLWTYCLYFGHHLFDIFLFWAPLFLQFRNEFLIHAIAVILVMVHWFSYDNKCILTVMVNKQCGYPKEEWLDSLKNMLNLRSLSEYFQFIWIGGLFVYDIYRLM
jgi:hypothetical protein